MLSDDQLRCFASDGYIVVPGVVPESLTTAAHAEIDTLIASEPAPADAVGKRTFFRPPVQLPAADAALRKSGALEIAEELVAPRRLDHGLDHIQIAVKLPHWRHRPSGPHIDGHRAEEVKPHSFTMLAAVFLDDHPPGEDTGNLWVWPGSHLLFQQLFRERGVGALLPVSGEPSHLNPPMPLPERKQVFAQRGDLLLAHFLLGHNGGGNVTDRPRRIIYYRLSCDAHDDHWDETFLDVFAEYAPLRPPMNLDG